MTMLRYPIRSCVRRELDAITHRDLNFSICTPPASTHPGEEAEEHVVLPEEKSSSSSSTRKEEKLEEKSSSSSSAAWAHEASSSSSSSSTNEASHVATAGTSSGSKSPEALPVGEVSSEPVKNTAEIAAEERAQEPHPKAPAIYPDVE